MAARATFTGFDPYKLNGVTVTDRELGHGSYATVLELEYMGLKCAGKKIHEVLLRQGGASYTVCRFEEECHLLSQVRHPNIVQFLGVHFQQDVPAPILVMEFLPTNLTSCIEQYGILPKEICYSILYDVALGLCYLHSQTPPIIHRDLSANNVLLTPHMTAKISDLGVARILNLTPLQVSRMTQTPGTPAYMPPEVMIANPKYDTSVDEFSYGISMIHIYSGRWPEPQVGPSKVKDDQLVPVTEAERREVFLRAIGNDHPLMDLILRCINNDPRRRPHASAIVERMVAMVMQFPVSFSNRLDILRHVEHIEEEKRSMREEGEAENQQKDEQILSLRNEAEQKEEEIVRLNLVYSSEVEQLKLQVQDLSSDNQFLTATKEADVSELMTKVAVCEKQIENDDKMLQQQRKQQENDRTNFEAEMARQREEFEIILTRERESCERLRNKKQELEAEISQSVTNTASFKHKISTMEAEVSRNRATIDNNESKLQIKTRALEEKQAIISGMSEQLTRARDNLISKQQVVQAGITWKQCADLPIKLCSGKAIIINDKVYCVGGSTDDDDNDYIAYCYDQTQDEWTNLPPLPVRFYTLGQVNGKLVAVGGLKKRDDEETNEVFTYDEKASKWKQTIRPMPTARNSPGVLSIQSALVVAGGETSPGETTNAVEIYKADTSQWYKADRLPRACQDISLVAIGNTCYALGGYNGLLEVNQAIYASVDDILSNAIPANQTAHSSSIADTQSAWKNLANTPMYIPAAAVLAGNLLTIGGRNTSDDNDDDDGTDMKEIYMFSPSTKSWIYFSDLPEARCLTAVAVLSSTEILVIGGYHDNARVNTTYKGKLHLKL